MVFTNRSEEQNSEIIYTHDAFIPYKGLDDCGYHQIHDLVKVYELNAYFSSKSTNQEIISEGYDKMTQVKDGGYLPMGVYQGKINLSDQP